MSGVSVPAQRDYCASEADQPAAPAKPVCRHAS